MKKQIGTIIFIGMLVICLLICYHQYNNKKAPQEQYANPYGITIEKIEETESEEYDTSKAYYKNYDDSGLQTYIISGVYNEVDEYIRDVRESQYCEYAFENEDAKIELKMTEEQRQGWIVVAEKNIKDVLESITEEDLYEYTFFKGYTELYLVLSGEAKGYSYAEDMLILLYNAEVYQILNGTEEWSIHVIVENMDTGKELVNVQYPQERIDITPDMWEK